MGFDSDLKEFGSFIYNVKLSNNLIENEFDYIFKGVVDDVIVKPNPEVYAGWIKIILTQDRS